MAKLSNGPEDKRQILDVLSEKIDRWIETPEAVLSIDVSVQVETAGVYSWSNPFQDKIALGETYTIVIRVSYDSQNKLIDSPEKAEQLTTEMLKDTYKNYLTTAPPVRPIITGRRFDKIVLDDLVGGGLITQEKRDKLWESITHKMDSAKDG